jgi:hypothetical protein
MTDSVTTIMRTFFFALAACVAVAPQAFAQDATSKQTMDPEDSTPKDEHSKARRDLMVQALQKYSVILDGNADQPATLESSTLLRYSNPLGDVADGVLSVYSTGPGERPAALANMYVHGALLNGLAMHCFADIHQGKVEVIRAERSVWSPGTRYSKFSTLPDGPDPSDNPALRLSQIKNMAARFEIIDGFREPNSEPSPHVLRMMSRPTHRYGKPDGEIIDGALFTYVVTTDPEACLLIEIHRKGDVISWEYMVLPMTIYSLEAKLDGNTVWTKPEAIVFGDPVAPFYTSSYGGDPGETTFRSLLPKQ